MSGVDTIIEGCDVEKIISEIASESGMSISRVEKDTKDFVEKLTKKGIVENA